MSETTYSQKQTPVQWLLNNRKLQKQHRQESMRLREITRRLQQLEQSNDGLVPKIMQADWNLVEVVALRHTYEKKLKALSIEKVVDSKHRLKLFDSVTNGFKKAHTKQIAELNLTAARRATDSVDELLLQVFDLSSQEKNKLMLDVKEYRELSSEAKSIRRSLI
ncbi:hypothetical protein A2707_04715 [Candidatus Saccharibacteria bacterium RIFCSPHIGHO2_01_FULL_45_15]|nr:MAG: hypothetical protein A2707_04715 [Candidatus Saccharibacteria bacterium RIFCSPHIGHO2_01_FULL_45_15]OGL27712.1 MAG: hypothetical protein A3C39_03355 [Candidatus Saccharibacteria bacterium RIFCSPHIGHO2_02_FULL_46_12]OGL32725.1 MAG: hypothetical protein A3E76_05245 [Candidatus Saccharibacteria bacterium RIFCSPHIGHO2_12_FULL_44_22]